MTVASDVTLPRIGWLDCSCGVSGDMLLGALSALGALDDLPAMLASLVDLHVTVTATGTTRHGLAAVSCDVTAAADQPPRVLADVLAIIARAAVPIAVRERATAVFGRLAAVEAAVHGTSADEVHFHEVGAVDSIVDILGACLGLHTLGLDQLVVSPIALGGGTVASDHGLLPVPTPAALGLLAGSALTGLGGPVEVELATPTGIALLAEWATASGPMPAMTVEAIGVGAGGRELADRANVVRLVVGSPIAAGTGGDDGWQTIAANVDDLDPRLWPGVLDALLAAGAADAWLTPILMKKGRPAHTVSALVGPAAAAAVTEVMLAETSTIGVRMTAVTKRGLDRSWISVDIDGQPVRVKLAHDGARRMNLAPEFEDVAAAARALGVTAKTVLARATAAALLTLDG
jgi:pyridinium-3,5-bisthiocarboxylic acid mononucleotide nickel chelatase